MNLNFLHKKSIKTRATLFTLAIFVVSLWALSFYASRMLRDDLKRLAGEQLHTTAHFVAGQVNEQLTDRLAALEGVARMVEPAMLTNANALQSFLEQRPSFQILFNGGYFITDAQGNARASLPVSLGRVGVNYMDRDHVAGVLKDGKAHISTPLIGKMLKTPVFSMAVPIRDSQGQVIGTLVGVIDLSRPSFLSNITDSPYGQTGGYLLISPKDKVFITATDKTRIMQPTPAPGINVMHDKYMQGFEGFGVALNSRGIEELTAAHSIPAAGWFLVAVLPTAEAFAPIKDMQKRMRLITLALTLLAGLLTWWMLRRELSPLIDAAKTLANMPESGVLDQLLPIARQDEVGALVGGFNRLLGRLKQREEDLKHSEQVAHARAFELTLSEARLNALLDDTNIHMWAFDGSNYTFVNKQWFDFTGQDPVGGLTIELWTAVVHPDDLPGATEVWLKHWETKTEHDNYFRLRRHDGIYRDFQCHTLPVFDEQGTFQYFQGFNLDITERKGVEDALRASEQRLRQFVENNASVMMLLDPDSGKIEEVNPAAVAYYGYSREQLLAMRISDINPMAPELIAAERQRALQQQRRYFLFQHRLASGELRDVEVYSNQIQSQGRTLLFSIVHDITERKLAEEALRTSEEKHRQLIESSHDIIYTLDSQGVFTFVSPAWNALLGHRQDQVLGHAFTPFVHPDDLATCFAALQALFETGVRQSNIEYRVKHLDGSWRWHSSNAVALKDSTGKVIGFEGNAKDITEQKLAQQLEQFRRQTLELLAGDATLSHVLEALVLGVQEVKPEMICSVLQLSADGNHLGQGVAPGLPDFYNAAINGIEIGIGVGSCGTAAFTGKRVIVEDIQTHPYWAPYKELAAQVGLGACWSEPIRAASGQVLGTFAIYHRLPHAPDTDDLRLIEESSSLASIAIEKHRAADALRLSEQRLALAVSGAQEGIWDLDLISGELYHSPQMARMLGYTEAELPAKREAWDAITEPQDIVKFTSEMGKHFKNHSHEFDVLVRLRHKNGGWRWVQSRGQATRNAQGRAVRFSGTQVDVTERKQLEDQVRQLAFFDALTGLPNRRMLDDRLSQAMAASKRSGLYGALMFLDLDNFKPLNDAHGHEVGDLLLKEVAHRVSKCLREVDTVARFGGDEFVVMLSELDADKAVSTEQARAVAEKIRTSVAEPYHLTVTHTGQPDTSVAHHCSASIGVVVFVNHEASQSDIMKWADVAMYQAKDAGRNSIQLYEPQD